MSNPWLKKNPFLSMWLSTANRMAGSLRSQATAETKRQVNAAVKEATQQTLKLGTDALTPKASAAKAKAKRRR